MFVDSIRQSKQQYVNHLSNKLQSESLSSKHWRFTLKAFITPTQNSSVPTLGKNGNIYSDETDKVNIPNNFFRDQTLLNDQNPRVHGANSGVVYEKASQPGNLRSAAENAIAKLIHTSTEMLT